jgi:hypothetical protein
MNRKKAMIMFSIIEMIAFLLIEVLYMMDKLSTTGYIIVLAVVILVSIGVVFTIKRKTE